MNLTQSAADAGSGAAAPDRSRGAASIGRYLHRRLFHASTVVFLVALAVRLLYLVGYRTNPFFADPQMDALYHDRWALQIARGDWLGKTVFFRAPLYAYFLGVVHALSGHSYLAARVVQFILGALSCVLVYRIGKRLHGQVVGLVAGILAALLGTSVYYEGELLLVVLEIFLSLAAIDLLLGASVGPRRHRVLGGALGAGLALGLAAITRPNFLVFLPVALLFLLRRFRRFGRAQWAMALALYLLGTAIPIVPVLVRNYVVGEDFVPIASQGGLNFYLGNNPAADGMAAVAPEFRPTWYGGVQDATRVAEEGMGRPLKPSEVSDYWLARGLAWARRDPGAWSRLLVKKFVVFWQAFEVPNNEDFYFFSRYSFLFRSPLLLTFGAVAPLGLAGILLSILRRRSSLPLVGFVAVYSLSVALFFVCGRFRAPVTPVLCVPAAYFLVEALGGIRRRPLAAIVASMGVFVGAAWFVNADFYGLFRRHNFAESYLRLGIVNAAEGRPVQAETAYRSAIAADPRFAEGHNNLGVLLMQEDRSAEALSEFEAALKIDPRYPRTLNNLAAWYEHEGRLPEARQYIDRALAIRGDDTDVRYNAGVIYGRQADFAGSAAHFRRLLQIEPGHLAGRLGLGKSLLMEGQTLEAVSTFNQVLQREPRQAEALYFLGMARARLNDLAGARRAWEECLEVSPGHVAATRQLEALKAIPRGIGGL
jgi:Flp pilus assembly protein TadD